MTPNPIENWKDIICTLDVAIKMSEKDSILTDHEIFRTTLNSIMLAKDNAFAALKHMVDNYEDIMYDHHIISKHQ